MGLSGDIHALAGNLFYTLVAALAGLLLGAVPGVLLPLGLRHFPTIIKIIDPFMVCGYGLPKLALAPLFILWFGIGLAPKIVLVASVVFFILYFNVMTGIQSVDVKLLKMARVLGATEGQMLIRIVVPASLQFVFAGLRVALPYAIGGVVIAELISSNRGLGYMLQAAAMEFATNRVFAVVITITAVCVAMNWVLSSIELHVLRWRSTMKTSVGS